MSDSPNSESQELNCEEWIEFNHSAHSLFDFEQLCVSKRNDDSDSEMSAKSDFTVEKLRGSENFYDWLFSMENYSAIKGYGDCIVEKSATEPTVPKEGDATKLNAAKGILVLSMETNLHPHIRKCTGALEIWKKVQQLFEDRGHMRRTGLLEKLVTNKLENCDSMTSYIANVMTTVSKLENIGLTVGED